MSTQLPFILGDYNKLVLLLAATIDAEHHIALIGVAVAEAESRASWEWFTEFLRKAHPRLSTPGISIASDRCKGLIGAVERSFPKAHHRWCYKHLERNIRARYGVATVPLFRKCVYAKTPAE